MGWNTRGLSGSVLSNRYLVAEQARETESSVELAGLDTRTGAAIRVHVVREGLGPRTRASRSLEMEAMVASEVAHPNVLTPRDVGVLEDGTPFMVTTHFGDETLEDRVCLGGALPVGDAVRVGLDLLSALVAAHERGIVHGELTPRVVRIVEKDGIVLQTMVTGFGPASLRAGWCGAIALDAAVDSEPLTRVDSGFGAGAHSRRSLAFTAPEVASGGAPTVASDVYAVGAMLYHAVTGFPPYTAPTLDDLADAVRAGALRAPTLLCPDLPARLARVLVQALQVEPGHRYASALEMLHALEGSRSSFGLAYARSRPVRGAADTEITAMEHGAWRSGESESESESEITRGAETLVPPPEPTEPAPVPPRRMVSGMVPALRAEPRETWESLERRATGAEAEPEVGAGAAASRDGRRLLA